MTMLKTCDTATQLVDEHYQDFYYFWQAIVLSLLLQDEPQKALQIVQNKLQPWFEREDFFYTYLKSRFLQLQAKVWRQFDDAPQTDRLKQEAEQLIMTGRQQTAGMHFSPELMQHIDLLVKECNNTELTLLYEQARGHLRLISVCEISGQTRAFLRVAVISC